MPAGKKMHGFTLIELVTVVVVLGVLSVGIAGFVRSGAQIFVDTTERDQLLSESRFVVERLNRELRNALPNSIRVSGDNSRHCIQFTPVVWNSLYLQMPVQPAQNDEALVVRWADDDPYIFVPGHQVVIYPTSTAEVYTNGSGKRYALDSVTSDAASATLNFSNNVSFTADSPAQRVYVVSWPVSYCMSSDGRIMRYQSTSFTAIQPTTPALLGNGVLMAENTSNDLSIQAGEFGSPFRYSQPTLTRNATILTFLQFALNEEVVEFNNEVHLVNVP